MLRWFTCTFTCLCVVNLWVPFGSTPAFSTSRGVHCYKHVCRFTFWTSLMQAEEHKQQWDMDPGSPWPSTLQASTLLPLCHADLKASFLTMQNVLHKIRSCRFRNMLAQRTRTRMYDKLRYEELTV